MASNNSQRDARSLYLKQKATAVGEAQARAETAGTTGAPVAMEEVVVTAPARTYEEIDQDVRAGEASFVKREAANALKSTAANLIGLPADLANLVNVESVTGRKDFEKGTSQHVKNLIGVDPGSMGDVLGDVNPADGLATGLKAVTKAGMLVPIGFWHNADEANEAEKIIEETVALTGQRDMPLNDNWMELNRQLFEKTKGWMLDFNGNIRRWFAPKEGGLNPGIIQPNGQIKVNQNSKLGDLIAPEVWSSFDPAIVQQLQNIPVRWVIDARGEWSDKKGIGLMMSELYKDPQKFIETLHHEIGHGFDALAGSGPGGMPQKSAWQFLGASDVHASFKPIEEMAKRGGNGSMAEAFRLSVDAMAKAKAFGTEMPPQAKIEAGLNAARKLFGEADVNNYIRASESFQMARKEDYDSYLRLSGEVLARAVGKHQEQGKFPLDDLDVAMSDIVKTSRGGVPLGVGNLPQRQPGGDVMIGKVTTEIVQKSGKLPQEIEAEIQSGKWDNEIQKLIMAQRSDAIRDKSRFVDPEANRLYNEAVAQLGVGGPIRPERAERINESFPMTTDRPGLMRPRDTQGARLDDSRGGPPRKYEGFGTMMEGAEELAVGREEVWKSGRFDIEAFKQKVETVSRQRAVTAAKGAISQATNKVKLQPKFWAFDPQTGKIAVVTAKEGGGYSVQYKTGKITDAVMEKVDIVADRKGLNEFISNTLWKRSTGTPIEYLDPTN